MRGQETWVCLNSASASLHDIALIILGGLRVLVPFSTHRMRPGEAPEEGSELYALPKVT